MIGNATSWKEKKILSLFIFERQRKTSSAYFEQSEKQESDRVRFLSFEQSEKTKFLSKSRFLF